MDINIWNKKTNKNKHRKNVFHSKIYMWIDCKKKIFRKLDFPDKLEH